MYLVICTVMVIITVLILKDTHVTVYYNGYSRSVALIEEDYDLKEEDYDLKVPVWLVLVILILGFIPVLNIMLYTVGYLFYIVHAVWNPDKLSGYTHKFNLRGNNFLTRIVKKIWKFLNVCV